ncbi:cation-translocating P-type ATPase [Actinokineospora bangkokensis]|uniref:P-type Cu(+) transporter n=1 Tax=Actinokineospora bangkokensis TaxID=1193682 RepID=A0A1Q9LR35_9PSEU|nr:cation-transporting P-type ATPase [Actinokineospora bangkokensis]OLR94485.1 ATPase [Actinokineospora bangkokensis]
MHPPPPVDQTPPVACLTDDQAARVRQRVGPNRVPEAAGAGVTARVVAQLRDPMILLLLAAAAIAVALRDATDAGVIAAVVVLNTAIGVAQQVRAEHALAALRTLAAPTTRVVRAGVERTTPAVDLVPGDLVRLTAGDIVPADAELLAAEAFQVDESALTGESVPVDKAAGAGERGLVCAGTVVTRGRAEARVIATGARSALGRIAAAVGSQRPRPTPLQRRLAQLGRVLVWAALALSALVAVLGLLSGQSPGTTALTALSLAVAAVPESLPAVVTLALALGARRMARHHAVVRSLPAVETLGSVTVLAADKTGTLTEGRMVVEELWTPGGGRCAVTGHGYDPVGEIRCPGGPPLELLRCAALCNDATIDPPTRDGHRWTPVGDPTEAALVALVSKGGISVAAARDRYPRTGEIPFDSARGRMDTTHRNPSGGWLVLTKGAPEVLLAPGGPLPDDILTQRARVVAADMAGAGQRVLALLERHSDRPGAPAAPGPGQATLLGLVAIADPPRPDAPKVVRALRRAGIRLVMITGDHPRTAAAIAARVGIAGTAGVATAADIPADTDAVSVYARTRPEHKPLVIQARQARGEVVAMTGDGVNDAPALRRADIGIAMGGQGTEVARQAADLVLTDDDLGTVVTAVAEGRRIQAAVRTFLHYALSGGLAEVAVMLLGPLIGLPQTLLPAQILWINLLTHGLPGVAFGTEPPPTGALRAGPRPPAQAVLGAGLWQRITWTGALIATTALAVGAWAAATGRPWQSLLFLTLGLAQLGVAAALRGPGRRPRFLDAAVAGAIALQLAAVTVPGLRSLLTTTPPEPSDLAGVAAVALLPAVIVRIVAKASTRTSPGLGVETA